MAQIPPLDDTAVLWSAPPAEHEGRPLLVVLHGYGSHEGDLFGLVPYLPAEFVVAAVRAPLSPPFPLPGWSWYPIEGLDGRRSDDITRAAERFLEWLDEVAPTGTVGLLGFSQGGAVSLQSLRLRPERFAFAVNLSGYVDAAPLPTDEALAEVHPPVFWGRGDRDDVIPGPLVAHTIEWLPTHTTLSGRVYAGLGHSVSQQELDDIAAFLRARL